MSDKGINFKHLHIENGRSFKKIDVPLANQGIVLIQGDNGVGKSTLWDILEAILYGSTPGDHKKDELTKNEKDATYTVSFEKNGEDYSVSLKRKKGKWSYTIQKNSINITEHAYKDAVNGLSRLIGLTKAEFEGSVHLTQESQHILIKSELAERKKYISNFFGIDDRYDQVHLAAKNETEVIEEQINKLSGMSHTKQMLEQELENNEIKNIEDVQNKLDTFQLHYDAALSKLGDTDKKIAAWTDYTKYFDAANIVKNPDEQIITLENNIVDNKSKLQNINNIKSRNDQAYKVNRAIDELEEVQRKTLTHFPSLAIDKINLIEYEKELQLLQNIKHQNDSVISLRNEIITLPKIDEIPIDKLEKSLLGLQLEYQTHAKSKKAKEKGICTECGSKFNVQDVQEEVTLLKELRENIDQLTEDYGLIKDRNTKVKRRKMIEDHLAKIPEFSEENKNRMGFLESFIPLKREFDETAASLKILSRMEIIEVIDGEEIQQIKTSIESDLETIEELKKCQIAKKLIPKKPKESEETLLTVKSTLLNEIHNLRTSIQATTQTIGECIKSNETYNKLTNQLEEINNKLVRLDKLKQEEFFWGKMVDAYGPKGLRIQQLEKMMNIVIQQLPVYCNILFKEKKLVFKHKVDPNNVKILACREEEDDETKDVNSFQHDISAFSGGEKDLMSTSFILTLADCVPYHKKANILILDEVDAQLDADGKYRYTNQLLPMLRKKHDSIFVISHNKEVQLANIYDQVWEIQKTNHTSTIKMTKINPYD